jgi:hypothetical protein
VVWCGVVCLGCWWSFSCFGVTVCRVLNNDIFYLKMVLRRKHVAA